MPALLLAFFNFYKTMTINGTKYHNPLFVFAMKAEAGEEFENQDVLFTGLGKVNASYQLTKFLSHYQPDVVINLGTAGSKVFNKGEIICCHQFVQRDMNVTELGFEKYKTPFSKEEAILDYGLKLRYLKQGICGTGDSFETSITESIYNVVDMEAYALALVCKSESIPFLCLKYISDGADDSAANDWNNEVKNAAKKLREIINGLK